MRWQDSGSFFGSKSLNSSKERCVNKRDRRIVESVKNEFYARGRLKRLVPGMISKPEIVSQEVLGVE